MASRAWRPLYKKRVTYYEVSGKVGLIEAEKKPNPVGIAKDHRYRVECYSLRTWLVWRRGGALRTGQSG